MTTEEDLLPLKVVANRRILKTVFDIWLIQDRCGWRRPHYPAYKVEYLKVGSATSFGSAEEVKMKIIAEDSISNIRGFRINEVPLDCFCLERECLRSYLYDSDGTRIDERLFPAMMVDGDYGIYPGRKPEETRFKEGDIVEVCCWDEMRLGVVVGLPVSFERALQINSNPKGFHLDYTDDSYVIIYDCSSGHDHVDALDLFKPKFKMHPAVEKRLQKAYRDYLNNPM